MLKLDYFYKKIKRTSKLRNRFIKKIENTPGILNIVIRTGRLRNTNLGKNTAILTLRR